MGDFSSKGLSASFLEAGIELKRLKTGTPARILGSSIDFSQLEEQLGDTSPTLFSFYDTRGISDTFHVEQSPESVRAIEALFHVEQTGERKLGWLPGHEQVSCWVTYTSASTQEVVQKPAPFSHILETSRVQVHDTVQV